MTNEQINIAIAESLGWKVRWQNKGGAPALENKPAGHCWAVWTNTNGCGLDSNYDPIFPPNYTADLNACHEFEKTLDDDLDLDYSGNLESVTGTRWGANNSYDMSKYRSATACQRCEAYLRTIGKWIE